MDKSMLPREYANVMLTYTTTERVADRYYGHDETFTVTRRAFYSKSSGYYDSTNRLGMFSA